MRLGVAGNQDNNDAGLPLESGPTYVCWSRMQAEAGQDLNAIVARKELERRVGEGLFFWGVGNAPSRIISALARANVPVQVVFSLMKSRAKATDVAPARVVAWRRFLDAHGAERALPQHALITSRGNSGSGPKRTHYALMCHSREPLALRRGRPFDPKAYRNAAGTGAPVGSSQVTALLRRVEEESPHADYEINLSACLTGSYWVRLTDPVELDAAKLATISSIEKISPRHWYDAVKAVLSGPSLYPETCSSGTLI